MGTTARHILLALAWACVLAASCLVLLYLVPEAQAFTVWMVMAAAFIPYALTLWVFAAVFFLLGGPRWSKLLAVPVLAALVLQLGWSRPYWPGWPPPASGTTVRVFAANVYVGEADPDGLASALRAADADVVVLLEATEPLLAAGPVQGVLAGYPHRVGRAAPAGPQDASGTVVLSRLPLAEVGRVPSRYDQYLVRVDAGPTPLTLLAAHPANMLGGARAWEYEGELLAEAVRPHLGEPLALVGDLNAVPEHVTLRRLAAEGLTLGAAQARAGWRPTYNAGLGPLPALLPLDHVLVTDRVTTVGFRTLPVPGSDHRAIVADLVYG